MGQPILPELQFLLPIYGTMATLQKIYNLAQGRNIHKSTLRLLLLHHSFDALTQSYPHGGPRIIKYKEFNPEQSAVAYSTYARRRRLGRDHDTAITLPPDKGHRTRERNYEDFR